MKARPLACFILLVSCAASNAQAPARRPDQFYTNGESVNAWTANPSQKAQTTLWFARYPASNVTYRQILAINYDSQPDKVFYVDPATRLFIGRFDLATDQFSQLPKAARKKRLEDIDDSAFAAPSAPPRISELFDPLPPGGQRGARDQLLPPPPTMKFPRLKNSTWDTNYMAHNRSQLRNILTLEGDRGTYRLSRGSAGQLTNVQYEAQSDGHLIRGDWALGKSNGWFRFNVPADNLNIFWGEFGFEAGRVVGAWDGFRLSQPRPPEEKSPRPSQQR